MHNSPRISFDSSTLLWVKRHENANSWLILKYNFLTKCRDDVKEETYEKRTSC